MTIVILERMDKAMVEKNIKKLKAKKQRVMNGFNTGTRDMKLKTAYRRKKRWGCRTKNSVAAPFSCKNTKARLRKVWFLR